MLINNYMCLSLECIMCVMTMLRKSWKNGSSQKISDADPANNTTQNYTKQKNTENHH